MAYCDWCRLDSDSEDYCVWCRRPIRRNVAAYASSYAGGVALLREEGGDVSDRATAIVGGVVTVGLLAIVIYSVISYGGQKAASDPLSKIAPSEQTWSGQRSAPRLAAATPAPRPTPAPPPQPTLRPAPQRAAPIFVPNASTNTAGAPKPSIMASSAYADSPPTDLPSTPGSLGMYIDRVKLAAAPQRNGNFTIEGSVTVANVSGHRLRDLEFSLVVGSTVVKMKRIADGDLGSGMTLSFAVRATDVEESVAKASGATIRVQAKDGKSQISDSLPLAG